MDTFLATWKFESSDNFENYLKALGISAPLRKLAGLTSPTVTIKKVEDGKNSGLGKPSNFFSLTFWVFFFEGLASLAIWCKTLF